MNQCLQNNAKMRQLGLLALSRILSTSPIILQETENNDHNDDPNFDDKAEDDANNDGNLSDDSLVPKTEALQDMESRHGSKKHKVFDLPLCHALICYFLHLSIQ
jgi:hypothetical protein